jgi:hypothetical protein
MRISDSEPITGPNACFAPQFWVFLNLLGWQVKSLLWPGQPAQQIQEDPRFSNPHAEIEGGWRNGDCGFRICILIPWSLMYHEA